jgi:hypothetical protein
MHGPVDRAIVPCPLDQRIDDRFPWRAATTFLWCPQSRLTDNRVEDHYKGGNRWGSF